MNSPPCFTSGGPRLTSARLTSTSATCARNWNAKTARLSAPFAAWATCSRRRWEATREIGLRQDHGLVLRHAAAIAGGLPWRFVVYLHLGPARRSRRRLP